MNSESITIIKNDPDRKSFFYIWIDLIKLFFKYKNKRKIWFYFPQLMYKKNSGKLSDYIHPQFFSEIHKKVHRKGKGEDPILQNKIAFHEYMKLHELPVPNYIGKLQDGNLIISCSKTRINSTVDLEKPFKELLSKYPSFFVKQVDSERGLGVFKIERIEDVKRIDVTRNYVLEETLIQHPLLSAFNPNCINGLRVVTFRDENKVHFATCFLRLGVGSSYVDNSSAGGVFIEYNLEINELAEIGYSKFQFGGRYLYEHPESNVKFKNKKLIFNHEIKMILNKAALIFDREIIGWDIAFTPDGPCIMEGNDNPSLNSMQIVSKGLMSHPIYSKLYSFYSDKRYL